MNNIFDFIRRNFNYIMLTFVVLILLIIYSPFSLEICIKYKSVPQGERAQIFYDIGKGFREEDSISKEILDNKVNFKIPKKIYNLRIDYINGEGITQIEQIEIGGGNNNIVLKSDEISKYFIYNNIESNKQKDGFIELKSENDPNFTANRNFYDILYSIINNLKKLIVFIKILIFIIYLLLIKFIYKKLKF